MVDEDGKDVPDGTSGEIVYRSPQLCEGYWDKPEETAAAFRDGWFHSGDLAVRDVHGFFTVVDRVKDVINSGGVLVASRQVEDVLYTHEGVAEVAVIGLPDDRWIEAVTAVVVPRGEVTEAQLIDHAREKLPHFKAPKRVVFVDELPRNASGKILKRELRERLADWCCRVVKRELRPYATPRSRSCPATPHAPTRVRRPGGRGRSTGRAGRRVHPGRAARPRPWCRAVRAG